ncbi:MAG: ABC transporter substrate-binding protein [Gammaproteobacteria bacterium]
MRSCSLWCLASGWWACRLNAADALNSHVSTLAKGIPAVQREDTDAILSLQPDLVLSSTRTPKEVEDRLRRARVRVARVVTPKGVDDIEAGIRLVAEAVQEAEKGEALIAEMARQAHELERLPAVGLRALYYTAGGWTAGRKTSIDVVLRSAGLKNAADLEGHRPVSLEWVLKTNPDLILVGAGYEGGRASRHLWAATPAMPRSRRSSAVG